MPEVIPYTDGIASTKARLEKLDPATGETAYANQAATLSKLKSGHNEVWRQGGLADQLADLRRQVHLRPFS